MVSKMMIRKEDFDEHGEIDCNSKLKDLHGKVYSLRIRKTGKNNYQAFVVFKNAYTLLTLSSDNSIWVKEMTLKQGSLKEVIIFCDAITGQNNHTL